MSTKVIVFGDTELGAGTITDDFIADKLLAKIINYYSLSEEQIDLVFNGDSFDYLKCPKIINNKATYPRHITAEISLHKTRLILSAHIEVIDALRNFGIKSNHHIYYLYGNHDPDLKFPEVQRLIKKELETKDIHFQYSYTKPGLHIEHGDAYDILHQQKNPAHFVKYRGKKILNLPFVSYALIDKFMVIKEANPFLERIKPESELYKHHPEIAKIIKKKTVSYFMKSIFYYPLRHPQDPTYRLPVGLFEQFITRMRAQKLYVESVIPLFRAKNASELKEAHHPGIYILGHRHDFIIEKDGEHTIMHPDTWRDEYKLHPHTKLLTPKDKHYIEVTKNNQTWKYKLHTIKSKRGAMDFNYVTKHQIEAAKQAAKEEEYYPLRSKVRAK